MTPLDTLRSRAGSDWPAIRKAYQDTLLRRDHLSALFRKRDSPDTTLSVFGSVARQEVTSGSDLDWILLIDGQPIPEHKHQERQIEKTLSDANYTEPGKSGVFGKMVGSHDLVHNIGGEDDLNSNTTRRVLLLLESMPIGAREAYDRVRLQILRRYLEDDRGLRYSSGPVRIPRFLLNDLTRYWRTVTVDFVYKQRAEDKKWAIRNAKLRMSRKLVFAAGLLRCFFCYLDPEAEDARRSLQGPARDLSPLTAYMEQQLAFTPIELVAQACLLPGVRDETIRDVFDSYDRFLAILDDESKRLELQRAHNHEDLRASPVWDEVRSVSGPFHEGLVSLFLNDNAGLRELTMKYGLF